MKAFPALRPLACASLLFITSATNSSAQLFHIVANDALPGVTTSENTGVAVDALFEFNYGGTPGLLRLTLSNLSGTARPAIEGGGFYTDGVLVGFGFDAPVGITYTAGSFTQTLAPGSLAEPFGVDFAPEITFDLNGLASFDFGAGADDPVPKYGLSGGYSAIFTLQFEGNLTNFNSSGFFANNGSDADIGFRFQDVGVNGEESEKVAFVVENPPIPEPSTYGFIGAALLMGIVARKRFRSRQLAQVK